MRILISLIISGAVLCAAPVHAQDDKDTAPKEPATRQAKIDEARDAFIKGTNAYENGDFETALASFTWAYKLTGSADLLYNIATVNDRMRRDEDALRAYVGYIEARPKSPDREHVEGRIKVLKASIAARERAERDAAAEAERKAQEAAMAAEQRVKMERPLTRYVGPGVGPWITIGVSSGALVAGAIVFGLGMRDKNMVEEAPEGTSFNDVSSANDRAPRRMKIGISMMSVGAAGVIGGVIWQLTGGREEEVPELSIGPTGISYRGTF